MNTVVREGGREGEREREKERERRENIRQLFTRQRRGVTSVHEANERLSGATPICSGRIVKFHATNAIALAP